MSNTKKFYNEFDEEISKKDYVMSRLRILHDFGILTKLNDDVWTGVYHILLACDTDVQIESLMRMMTVKEMTAEQFIERYNSVHS